MELLRKTCLLLALLLVAGGCGGPNGSEEELYVFLPNSLDSEFWVDANEGLEAEAERLGVSAEFLGPTEEDPAEQVTLLEETIAREPAGLAVSADDTEEVEDAVARARETGIPVISWAAPLPDSEVVAHVGTDHLAAGEEAAGALAKELGGTGQVALLATGLEEPEARQRIEGFRKGLEDHPDVAVVYSGITGDLETVPSKVKFLLQSRPDIDALFGVTGPEVRGAAEAVRDSGGCGEVRVAGFDATPATLELMRAGCVQLLVAPKPGEITARALRLLRDLERGAEPEDIRVGVNLLTPRDLE
jgi:ABC-type sugar transport system substrate-binding protein